MFSFAVIAFFFFRELRSKLVQIAIYYQYQFLETLETLSWRVRVNYEVPCLSKLHEDFQKCFKDFQQVWYELEMFKVYRDDMPYED